MKIIIPVAGIGSRLKPHTFTTPKPLMEVAGKPILHYIIEECKQLNPSEIIFVVGYKRKQIKDFVKQELKGFNYSFVVQRKRNGDGAAVYLGLKDLMDEEELFVVFGDTLIDFDLKKSIENTNAACKVFTKQVQDPEHYGVVNVKDNLEIYETEEKPENPKSDLAIIGAYYFKSLQFVKSSLKEKIDLKLTVKGEYKIIQVIQDVIEYSDMTAKAEMVNEWFDCGRPSILLESNKYYLAKKSSGDPVQVGNSIVIPPSYVSSSAILDGSVIGPYASIGKGCIVKDSIIKNSIIHSESKVGKAHLENSILGKEAMFLGKTSKFNLGDKSHIEM